MIFINFCQSIFDKACAYCVYCLLFCLAKFVLFILMLGNIQGTRLLGIQGSQHGKITFCLSTSAENCIILLSSDTQHDATLVWTAAPLI
jgi:hypothetical protein